MTIPFVYARFENSCEERVPQSFTVHVNVMDSRGSMASGSFLEVTVSVDDVIGVE